MKKISKDKLKVEALLLAQDSFIISGEDKIKEDSGFHFGIAIKALTRAYNCEQGD